MPPFFRLTHPLRPLILPLTSLPQPLSRPLHLTPLLRLKEGLNQDGQEVERKKQNQHHDSEARRDISSQSEEVVGAEQESVKDDQKHMEELQKETARKSEEEHPKGKA